MAQPLASEPENAPASVVGFGSVDSVTVRVFAIGTVGVETFEVWNRQFQVASPSAGHGTGFWFGNDGLILTANHVVDGAVHLVIRKPGKGGFLPARVVFQNEEADIAVLQVDERVSGLRFRPGSTTIGVRQTVFAIGYPIDPTRTQAQSSKGIVAGQTENQALQLDINVNPGNSGGPLVDEQDKVVGMVVARGNVEAGVQGIGYAVGVPLLREAIEEAKRLTSMGGVRSLTAKDQASAQVVDELLNQGGMRSVTAKDDLEDVEFANANFEEKMRTVADHIDDPDLLVFVAASLWNAALVIRYGGVREIGDTTLTETSARLLADRLKSSALLLVNRATTTDSSIVLRSEFANSALDYQWPEFTHATYPQYRLNVKSGFAARGNMSSRYNPETGSSALGFGLDLQYRLGLDRKAKKTQLFVSMGIGMGNVTLALPEMSVEREATHRFYSAEMLLGISVPLTKALRMETSGGIAPCSYSITSPNSDGFGEASASQIILGHLRATVGVAYHSVYLGTGIRRVGSTYWIEPVSLGLAF